MKTSQLVKIAIMGGFFLGTSGYMMRFGILHKLKKSDYYKLALTNVLAHKPLVEFLGDPVGFGNVDLTNSLQNFAQNGEARMSIPLKGSNTSGYVHFIAKRDDAVSSGKWRMETIQVEVESRKTERILVPVKFPTIDTIPTIKLTLQDLGKK